MHDTIGFEYSRAQSEKPVERDGRGASYACLCRLALV